jgi:hypothetical protein
MHGGLGVFCSRKMTSNYLVVKPSFPTQNSHQDQELTPVKD